MLVSSIFAQVSIGVGTGGHQGHVPAYITVRIANAPSYYGLLNSYSRVYIEGGDTLGNLIKHCILKVHDSEYTELIFYL